MFLNPKALMPTFNTSFLLKNNLSVLTTREHKFKGLYVLKTTFKR